MLQDYEIIVDKESLGIIKEINNYVWHEKGERPIEHFNHYIDAMRYGLMYLAQGLSAGVYAIR